MSLFKMDQLIAYGPPKIAILADLLNKFQSNPTQYKEIRLKRERQVAPGKKTSFIIVGVLPFRGNREHLIGRYPGNLLKAITDFKLITKESTFTSRDMNLPGAA